MENTNIAVPFATFMELLTFKVREETKAELQPELDALRAENEDIKDKLERDFWYGQWKEEEKKTKELEAELAELKEFYEGPALPIENEQENNDKEVA